MIFSSKVDQNVKNHPQPVPLNCNFVILARLRGHYVADIRSGICDPNARPVIVKETAGEGWAKNLITKLGGGSPWAVLAVKAKAFKYWS